MIDHIGPRVLPMHRRLIERIWRAVDRMLFKIANFIEAQQFAWDEYWIARRKRRGR